MSAPESERPSSALLRSPLIRASLALLFALALGWGGAHVVTELSMWLDAPALDLSLRYLGGWLLGGLLPALAAAALIPTERARGVAFRAAAAAFGALLVGIWAEQLWLSGRYALEGEGVALLIGGDLLALAAALALVLRRPDLRFAPRVLRRVLLLGTLGLALLWGSPILREAIEEHREQRLPPVALELAAAYDLDPLGPLGQGEIPAVVVDREGQLGEVHRFEGRRYNVHRSDALRLPAGALRRVRWHDPGGRGAMLTLRFDAETTRLVDERARVRASQLDLLFVEGEPSHLVFHGAGIGLLAIGDRDRGRLWQLYRRLTRPR